jgi:chromosome transmission fidelity protein 1
MFDLVRHIQASKLAFKVESYAAHLDERNAAATQHSQSPVLHTLSSFLLALANLSTEGRIFFEKVPSSPPDIKLSYLLLSPTHAFSSIASSARAVILAGGTMSPFEDYKAHLFPTHLPETITTLSCGHVIPAANLCVWTLASSRAGQSVGDNDLFDFSFQRRSDKSIIRRLGLAIINICSVVPDGVVVFFPSYGYLDEVVSGWQAPDNPASIWERLQNKKAVFRDGKSGSSDEILAEYTAAVLSGGRAALLLSVVGGKMSEGINFSDRLGRCVVVVGLPYPNIASPEWKARLEYIESSHSPGEPAAAKQAARDFYENACMRAVNQSIGRAIRHRADYAAIVLADRRFATSRIRGKLPRWIRSGMVEGSEDKGLQGLMGALNGFFRAKKTSGSA